MARLDVLGVVQHVMARGIEGAAIFRDEKDRETFLAKLAGVVQDGEAQLLGWALLSNHFHLVLRPRRAYLKKMMRRLMTGYATWCRTGSGCRAGGGEKASSSHGGRGPGGGSAGVRGGRGSDHGSEPGAVGGPGPAGVLPAGAPGGEGDVRGTGPASGADAGVRVGSGSVGGGGKNLMTC